MGSPVSTEQSSNANSVFFVRPIIQTAHRELLSVAYTNFKNNFSFETTVSLIGRVLFCMADAIPIISTLVNSIASTVFGHDPLEQLGDRELSNVQMQNMFDNDDDNKTLIGQNGSELAKHQGPIEKRERNAIVLRQLDEVKASVALNSGATLINLVDGSNPIELPEYLQGVRTREDLKQLVGRLSSNDDNETLQKIQDFFGPGMVFYTKDLITEDFANHLDSKRQPTALGQKYRLGNSLSNQMGNMAGFAKVQLALGVLFSDCNWLGADRGAVVSQLENNYARPYILSTTITPDFELPRPGGNVAIDLFGLREEALLPIRLTDEYLNNRPSIMELKNETNRLGWDKALVQHQLFFVTKKGLPARRGQETVTSHVIKNQVQEKASGKCLDLEAFKSQIIATDNGLELSAEAMFGYYKYQLQNEFRGLHTIGKDFCYTIDPAVIFLEGFRGDKELFARIHAMALKEVLDENPTFKTHFKKLAFNAFSDEGAIQFYSTLLERHGVDCVNKNELLTQSGKWKIDTIEGLILVLHNNSDGFGDNFVNEGQSSLDGVLGLYSSQYFNTGNDAQRKFFPST